MVIGWTTEKDSACALVVERGRRLLPFVVDAVSSVIVSILLVERIHELEATRIRDSLREMELLKAELLGTVSHELRSPLASIKGYAATLLRHERRLSREERHQFLLAINEASDRLELIIERLLPPARCPGQLARECHKILAWRRCDQGDTSPGNTHSNYSGRTAIFGPERYTQSTINAYSPAYVGDSRMR